MKKATSILRCLLFAISALYPTGLLVCTCFRFDFTLGNVTAYTILLALLSVTTVVFSFLSKEQTDNRVSIIFQSMMLPLALINTVLYPLERCTFLVLACVTVALVSAFFVMLGARKSLGIKILALVLSTILSLSIGGFVGFIGVIFGDFGYVAVVQTIESPSSEYRAEVLDVNHGALGGDTVVYVYETDKYFNLFIFTVSKEPKTVYMGNWGEFNDMNLHWKNDHCLVINHTEYDIQ